MKKISVCEVVSNDKIAENIFDMRVSEEFIARSAIPGQFVNFYLNRADLLLPRPISVCETYPEDGEFRVVYRASGEGTRFLSALKPGDTLRALLTGNGFSIGQFNKITIAGGGIGVPPLLFLARKLREKNRAAEINVFLGFGTARQVILTGDFKKITGAVHVSTDDGGFGFRGNVAEQMRSHNFKPGVIYACGPRPMLQSVHGYAREAGSACFVSMEERMACGLGACVGCAVKIKTGNGFAYKKVCSDGPVFDAGEVAWDE